MESLNYNPATEFYEKDDGTIVCDKFGSSLTLKENNMSNTMSENDVILAKFNGYTDALPPRDGSAIQLLKPDGKTIIIKFDSTVYGGKGGWFNDQNHAVKFPINGLWKLYLLPQK